MKKLLQFKWIYLIYFSVLAVLVLAATLYVRGLLAEYEQKQPENAALSALSLLQEEAKDPKTFFETYQLPAVDAGTQEKYLALFFEEGIKVRTKSGLYAEDEKGYLLEKEGFPMAEVLLKAKGPQQTKLAVFSLRDWQIQSVKPLLSLREYTVEVPKDFSVQANGTPLANGTLSGNKMKYTLSGVYLQPTFKITDPKGQEASYAVQNFRVLPELYEYSLTLPNTLSVAVNGEKQIGVPKGENMLRYDILMLQKPTVSVTDLFGNAVSYEGGARLPLTQVTLLTPADHTVTVEGVQVPKEAVQEGVKAEYEILMDLVSALPRQKEYQIAVLKENATIEVRDGAGAIVPLKEGESAYDLTPAPSEQGMPEALSKEVDVLQIAKNWSLYMSNDYDFSKIASQMVPDSYQYQVAKEYSKSVDRLFFSSHTLLNPAFTEEAVSNYQFITEDSFSVQIRFVKHMRLNGGKVVDDAMNDRFYFVKQNGVWLLAGMKEVAEIEG